MGKGILVIGSLNMDMSVRMGEMPQVGETIMGDSLAYSPGGKGANQACAVGKLKGNVKMLGCIGQDEFGQAQERSLTEAGVDVTHLKKSAVQPTGTAVIYVNSHGDNSIVVISGANGDCDPEYLKEQDQLFEWCDYVLMQLEVPMETIRCAARRAKELGKTVILNPAPAPDHIDDDILKLVDYLTPNETELMRLSKAQGEGLEAIREGAAILQRRGVKNVLVTMGEHGALLVKEGSSAVYPANKVKAVDTTAAGDCFNGAFVVGLSEGMDEGSALLFANKASAVAVTRKGAQESIPERSELE